MRAFKTKSDYHPDDKDILDFLHASKPAYASLQSFLAVRGIFVSPNLVLEDLYAYVASLPLNWSQCETLLDLTSLRAKSSFETETEIEGDVTLDQVEEVFRNVRSLRGERNKERYEINRVGDSVVVKVRYVDIDYRKTRLFQEVEDEIEFTVSSVDGGLMLTHDLCDRSAMIESNFLGLVEEDLKKRDKNFKVEKLELSHILTAEGRNNFFWHMFSGVDGFKFDKLNNAKVRKFEVQGDDDDELGDSYLASISERIKRLDVYGDDIYSDEQFQNFLENGFYIISADWTVSDVENSNDKVHYKLSFRDSGSSTVACFKVVGVSAYADGIISPRMKPSAKRERYLISLLKSRAAEMYIKHKG